MAICARKQRFLPQKWEFLPLKQQFTHAKSKYNRYKTNEKEKDRKICVIFRFACVISFATDGFCALKWCFCVRNWLFCALKWCFCVRIVKCGWNVCKTLVSVEITQNLVWQNRNLLQFPDSKKSN